ncbi:retrovirus-related pol polyprotein from transposon TNT 1-94 [Tanacetum coccineum]
MKSWLWHRRLSHLNFDYITPLAKHGVVRGLPKLKYQKDHLCSACALGKSKKHSHRPKAEDSIQEKLYLLHMDLYGPMRIQSINGRKYILVIIDDYSRTDNGIEFVNQTLKAYYEEVEILHQTSVACTPQQNGVVEKRNHTLVETGHTISLIRKRHNKTPYELLHDRKPNLSYLRVFGALCYPTNDVQEPGPKFFTPGTISSRLVQNIPSSTPYVPLTKNNWEILFQPMFNEYLSPLPCVDPQVLAIIAPEPTVSTCTPSSTTIDQDAPSSVPIKQLKKHHPWLFLSVLKKLAMILKLDTWVIIPMLTF